MGRPVQTAKIGNNGNADATEGDEERKSELIHSPASSLTRTRCRTLFSRISPVKQISTIVSPRLGGPSARKRPHSTDQFKVFVSVESASWQVGHEVAGLQEFLTAPPIAHEQPDFRHMSPGRPVSPAALALSHRAL